MGSIHAEPMLELALFSGIYGTIEVNPQARGRAKLFEFTEILNQNLVGDFTKEQMDENLSALKRGWKSSVLPWLNQRPYILRNYFQYRLYHDRFAIDKSIPVMKQLYLLVVDYFYVKSLLSAYVLEKGEITEQTVVDVMYSYHSYRQHNELAKAQFMAGIDSVKRNDDLSVLQLLV